jgi:hypothetical protein
VKGFDRNLAEDEVRARSPAPALHLCLLLPLSAACVRLPCVTEHC